MPKTDFPKLMEIAEMQKILNHLCDELVLTSADSPYLIWAQMLDRVADALRAREKYLRS